MHIEPGLVDGAKLALSYTTAAACIGYTACLLYTSPSPRDQRGYRMPSSA